MDQRCLKTRRLHRLELGQPILKKSFVDCGSGNMGSLRKARGQALTMLVRVSRRGVVHATFCGTSCIGGATLSPAPARAGSTSVATRPGLASPSRNAPPCNVQTAEATLR